MTALTWRHPYMGYAGSVYVAAIYDLRDAVEGVERGFKWEMHGVCVKYADYPTFGTLKTLGGAQRAAGRAWGRWLEAAGVETGAITVHGIQNEAAIEIFRGNFKGHVVKVQRNRPDYADEPSDGSYYHLSVEPVPGVRGRFWSAWWGNADHTLEEAVEEALIGSQLITEAQRKFGRKAA